MNPVYSWREVPETAFAVIGDPIGHSLSPVMQTAALRAVGRDETYLAVHVPVGEVDQALDRLKSLGTLGVNVTVPHKFSALQWSTKPDRLAQLLGAANTLNLQSGESRNTDAAGFALMVNGIVQNAGRALVLGAGGSSRAVLLALEDLGLEVDLYNRTRSRAEELVSDLNLKSTRVVDDAVVDNHDLIVNTTSASHTGEMPTIDFAAVKIGSNAVDLSYSKEGNLTPFLSAALNNGLLVHDGRAMLVYQGAMSLQWWLGLPESELENLLNPMAAALGVDIKIWNQDDFADKNRARSD